MVGDDEATNSSIVHIEEKKTTKMGVKVDLNDLYKTLKKHDAEILKRFGDETLSDDHYFFCAINGDIMSNGLGIVTNLLCGNERSVGVDQNCRSLIEAFVILRMKADGVISDNQLKLYRYQHALVEKDNFRWVPEKDASKEWGEILSDFGFAEELLCKIYGIDEKRLKDLYRSKIKNGKKPKLKISLDDPNLYLKSSPSDKTRFGVLTNKYPILGEHTSDIYRFFSLFIHPRFEMNTDLDAKLYERRRTLIYCLLDRLVHYLADSKLLVLDDSISGFKEDFFENPILENNRKRIGLINNSFQLLGNEFCEFPEGTDLYTKEFLEQMRCLLIDFEISESLGYQEQVVGKFKPFAEYYSVYVTLNSSKTLDEFKAKKLAFCLSSRLQINEFTKRVLNIQEDDRVDERLHRVFEDYYKDAYQVDFETFVRGLSGNSYYFLSPKRKSFNSVVTSSIDDCMAPSDKSLIHRIYKIAEDMSHASGYCFDSSPGIQKYFSHKTIATAWKMMTEYALRADLTLSQNGRSPNIKPAIELFSAICNEEQQAADVVLETFKNDI